MSLVQQTVLLVNATPQRWEASIQAETDGIHAVDRREMLDWFNRVSGSQALPCETESIFFHPLPSGRFVLAKMVPRRETAWTLVRTETSFYVHALVLSRKTLLQFANNPLRIDRLARKRGFWLRPYQVPATLKPIRLSRGGPMLDRRLLTRTVERYGAEPLARLLQSSFDSVCTLFSCERRPLEVIETLLMLLPVRWRTELTFSTELHFSLHCPVKLIGQPSRAVHASPLSRTVPSFALRSRLGHLKNGAPLPTGSERTPAALVLDPWPLFACHVLRRRNFALLENCLVRELLDDPPVEPGSPEPDGEKLEALGNDWLDRLFTNASGHDFLSDFDQGDETWDAVKAEGAMDVPLKTEPPTDVGSPAWLKPEISALDSFTARALFGDATALELLRNRWERVAAALPRNERNDLRIEYVRLVHSMLTRPVPLREPKEYRRGLDALDVLAVFLDEHRG